MRLRFIVPMLVSTVAMGATVDDTASVAQVTVMSGPRAGKYDFASADACVMAPSRPGGPPGLSVTLSAPKASVAIDIPSIEAHRLGAFWVELVVADANSSASRRNTASTTLVIDTRPDSALEKYQRDERGPNGMRGSGAAKLQQQAQTARLEFQGQTAEGVKLQGTVECRRIDRELGR
jgi:hypothetical protein